MIRRCGTRSSGGGMPGVFEARSEQGQAVTVKGAVACHTHRCTQQLTMLG